MGTNDLFLSLPLLSLSFLSFVFYARTFTHRLSKGLNTMLLFDPHFHSFILLYATFIPLWLIYSKIDCVLCRSCCCCCCRRHSCRCCYYAIILYSVFLFIATIETLYQKIQKHSYRAFVTYAYLYTRHSRFFFGLIQAERIRTIFSKISVESRTKLNFFSKIVCKRQKISWKVCYSSIVILKLIN